MLDFVLPLKLRQNLLPSWKTRRVYEQNDIKVIARFCEKYFIAPRKKANFTLLETAQQALTKY